MALRGFDELLMFSSASPQPVAVAGGDDITVLQAMVESTTRGWVRPILFGNELRMRELANEHRVDLLGWDVVNSDDPALDAVAAVRRGDAKLLMKGQIATPALMKAVLHADGGLRTGKVICQVVLMEIPRDGRRFLMADTGITISPSVDQLAQIIDCAERLSRALGCSAPRVGLMAASEKVSDSMPETHLAGELQTVHACDGRRVIGPVSFDLAYSHQAGERKRVTAEGIGAVDIMVFPNLLSANLTVKAIMYTADCRFGGVLMGAACPIVFMSRADDAVTRIRSLALALTLVHEGFAC